MVRWLAWLVTIVVATSAVAQDGLPKRDGDDSLDIEPPLLIKDGKPLAALPASDNSARDPEQLQSALDRARRSAGAGERQFKAGIIAKVQVEERALKVVRLEADLANARLQLAKDEHAAQQERFGTGEITRAELDAAAVALANATEAARIANENRERAEVEAAQTNLRRQQKLLALGSAHKADVNRAEAKLSELIRQR
jgi:outer membrane protein TolC